VGDRGRGGADGGSRAWCMVRAMVNVGVVVPWYPRVTFYRLPLYVVLRTYPSPMFNSSIVALTLSLTLTLASLGGSCSASSVSRAAAARCAALAAGLSRVFVQISDFSHLLSISYCDLSNSRRGEAGVRCSGSD